MRKIFLLSGAPGSGKNTFLKNNNLTEYAIGLDDLRALLSGPHQAIDGVSRSISKLVTDSLVEFFLFCLENRMRNGETIFVNNCVSSSLTLDTISPLIKDFDYQVKIIR